MDPGKTAPSRTTLAAARTDRPLGRGLEDVSHLFLSQTTEEATARALDSSRRLEPSDPAAADSTDTVVLSPGEPGINEHLGDVLMELVGAVEDGLRGIDTNLPCDPHDDIDLLAVDRAGQLVIVDYDTSANDRLVLRGIGHFDWIARNLPIVRRMYPGRPINFSAAPRLLLLAPDFSALALSAARQIHRPQLCCVRYRFVATPGGPGVIFDPVATERG